MTRRSGLGRGLGALIPTEMADEGAIYREIDIASITPNPFQPRIHFDEATLEALAASVAQVGIIQPVLVRQTDDGYELIAGERRWRAARRAGLTSIPAIVRATDDMSSLETAVVENLHRQDLNPLEEAAAYQQLIDDFELTQDEVSQRVGRSRSAIANTIRLLQLPASVQRRLIDEELTAGHARALLAAPDAATQEALADEIVANNLTVRQIEQRLRPAPRPATDAPGADPGSVGPAPGPIPEPGILELEELLAARLATRVRVRLGKGPGKITIEFADLDDLERIYRVITPPGTVL
ncbi:MAG: ParB/RepB/Spo0J family partition protein [Acidimicrobiales bacterium]